MVIEGPLAFYACSSIYERVACGFFCASAALSGTDEGKDF